MSHISLQKRMLIAAPSSGSGKTVLTLGLLRALQNAGHNVVSAKAGPDYIDPGFHKIASGSSSVNLDPWAMSDERVATLAADQGGELLVIEAMMGLFDGAADGSGSAADLAIGLGCPVVLVVDAAKQSHSIAALVQGFRDHRGSIKLAGIILNKVGSARHEAMLRSALEEIQVQVFGAVYRNEDFKIPERHLGLVQAGELQEIDAFIEGMAAVVTKSIDLEAFVDAASSDAPAKGIVNRLPSLGQRVAIARDRAFTFIYSHFLEDWKVSGAEISFFSPLNDEGPDASADAVFLPGGYPELHAGKLANSDNFKFGLKLAANRGALIYGECGGYMVLGESLIDEDGIAHEMAGLLKLETSFAKRKLHLGYRNLNAVSKFTLGAKFAAHEFHYTSAIREQGAPLFDVSDALGSDLGSQGLRDNNVMGSYMHVIDQRNGI